MSVELLFGLIGFAFAASITPGPNNLMLMASGTNFGIKASIPHLLGINIGHSIMSVLIGLGLAQLLQTYPMLLIILKGVSVLIICYFAYNIAFMHRVSQTKNKAKPLSFTQAMLFQWVNPKAWVMTVSSMGLYNPSNSQSVVFLITFVFCLTNLPCVSSWLIAGQKLKSFLSINNRMVTFNYIMAILLVMSMLPILLTN